ncbi:hypothetical protein CHS0354_032259 [Potamilus streckersoni]|uniref:Uncharacterized protein n=1 Tax=Potamilus streckersoni TaxID=2493646 RepID=A0AAE0VH34_9BIVA|nr:hypothetical protein CHS0354_032259 [Potamilus streckersoni]
MLRIFRSRVVQHAKKSNLFSIFGNSTVKDVSPCVWLAPESAVRTVNIKQYASGPEGNQRLSNFDKKVLVWSGYYKNVLEVPETISTSKLIRARDWCRIRVCMLMIIGTILGCVYMVWSGKRMLAEGKTVPKMAREKAAKLRADHIADTAQKAEVETKT